MSTFSFTLTRLIGGSVLVKGQDLDGNTGSAILYSEAWNAAVAARTSVQQQKAFDVAVREFFAPIIEAAEAAQPGNTVDWGKVVIKDEVQGIRPEMIRLDPQGILLRILDEGRGDLLRWADAETLVAIEE